MSLDPQWLEGVNINQPISELIEPEWLEAKAEITFTLEELASLEEQGREYLQELYAQGLLDGLPPLGIPDRFQEQAQDKDPNFGR